jgi:hypothetical protein
MGENQVVTRQIQSNARPRSEAEHSNMAFAGDFTSVLAKHSKHFSLEDALSIGVDRMQRNFDPMQQQVERWRVQQLSGEVARLTISVHRGRT